jgi:hypothetical protein
MMVVRLVGLAEEVDDCADEVKHTPAHIQPVEARWHALPHKKVQYQVSPGAHEQARERNELEAVEGRWPVKFG